MSIVHLDASRDPVSGQVYVPPRSHAADGSLRQTEAIQVPAQGTLYSMTRFHGQAYGIVDLDCGARIQVVLAPGTDQIGTRVLARSVNVQGQARFSHA